MVVVAKQSLYGVFFVQKRSPDRVIPFLKDIVTFCVQSGYCTRRFW